MTKQPHRHANNNAPRLAATQPLLTIERAIADDLCPASLRQVAAANNKLANGDARLRRQASNLIDIAGRLELLGFGRKEAA